MDSLKETVARVEEAALAVRDERDRLREACIVALAALQNGRPTEAKTVLKDALDGVGLDDGRESARIIAAQYRRANMAEEAWERAQRDGT